MRHSVRVGGTIWCLPLGVVTAIMLALDWQRKYTMQDAIQNLDTEENLIPKQFLVSQECVTA